MQRAKAIEIEIEIGMRRLSQLPVTSFIAPLGCPGI
jgi:hypothetical protein